MEQSQLSSKLLQRRDFNLNREEKFKSRLLKVLLTECLEGWKQLSLFILKYRGWARTIRLSSILFDQSWRTNWICLSSEPKEWQEMGIDKMFLKTEQSSRNSFKLSSTSSADSSGSMKLPSTQERLSFTLGQRKDATIQFMSSHTEVPPLQFVPWQIKE